MGVLRRARENYFPFSLVRTHFFIFMDKPSVEVLSSRRQGEFLLLLRSTEVAGQKGRSPSLSLFRFGLLVGEPLFSFVFAPDRASNPA
ncbi:hypothetical protein VIGAN_08208100 [Vigna angularis var. angularis]|uniref:Uncharacterized protein n=1 Tax=Vigna angularis var. angularis TaxID=157739 RepID=A0A0S3SRC7_PHAAN|nr:hypothetical protein VIGAN_08208100 [Vigna angularis var. angularis]